MFGSNFPVFAKTVLLPFNEDIIVDGLLQPYSLFFEPGITGQLKSVYQDAAERGQVITSLLPSEQPVSRDSLAARAQTTNTKVIDAFQKHQYRSGSSPKTVERDTLAATAFAHYLLVETPEPASLRTFERDALQSFLLSQPTKMRKTAGQSLKRFLAFLRDTNRLDWEEAGIQADLIKGLTV